MSASWRELFEAGAVEARLRLVCRGGEPVLVLPAERVLARRALGLYPAQRWKARWVRRCLDGALRLPVRLPLAETRVGVNANDPFVNFLRQQAGGTEDVPPFAIYAGNAAAAGRRFVVLVFDGRQRPVAVVKAGLDAAAWGLIEQERRLLAELPASWPGLPQLLGGFEGRRVRAFATRYVGEGWSARQLTATLELLGAWVDTERRVELSEIPAWKRLETAVGTGRVFRVLAERCRKREVRPVLFHGDFAPWNLRLAEGKPVALDWERGERVGMPGWDWFHFVIQPSVLVERESTRSLARRLEELLKDESFRRYAARTGIAGVEREMVLLYLLYDLEIIRPTEGAKRISELMERLMRTWIGA